MVERVQGIAPSRRVRYDEGRSFGAREGFAESGGGQNFERQLKQAMRKRRGEKEASPSEAYVLDVARPTQSLFYDRQASLERIRAYLHEENAK